MLINTSENTHLKLSKLAYLQTTFYKLLISRDNNMYSTVCTLIINRFLDFTFVTYNATGLIQMNEYRVSLKLAKTNIF